MEALIQRVNRASVAVDGEIVGRIGAGALVLLGVAQGDGVDEARWLARKVAELRIFEDSDGRFNLSLLDTGGEALVVSQFTLLAETRRGRRPSFVDAAPPETAEALVLEFEAALRDLGVHVDSGRFGAHMLVELVNDGPVTIMLDTADLQRPRKG